VSASGRGGPDESDRERQLRADLRTALAAAGLSAAQIDAWSTTRTGWLDGQAPADLLATEPDLLRDAARRQGELPFY